MNTRQSSLVHHVLVRYLSIPIVGAAILGLAFAGWLLTLSLDPTPASGKEVAVLRERGLPAGLDIEHTKRGKPPGKAALRGQHEQGVSISDAADIVRVSPRNEPAGKALVQSSNTAAASLSQIALGILADMEAMIGAAEQYTSAQIYQIIRALNELIGLGNAAVPFIKEFLLSKQDVDLTQSEGGQLTDYPTLRLNLIGVLNKIGSTDATDAMIEILRSTSDPAEIGLLAHSLETHAAGTYRADILNAARGSLLRIRHGKQDDVGDAAPLFAVLQDYGDASVVLDIEGIYPRWSS